MGLPLAAQEPVRARLREVIEMRKFNAQLDDDVRAGRVVWIEITDGGKK